MLVTCEEARGAALHGTAFGLAARNHTSSLVSSQTSLKLTWLLGGVAPVSPVQTPTEGQKARRPSYFARPQIRAQPLPVAAAEAAAAAPAAVANSASQGGAAAAAVEAAAVPAKKELPPLLRARLAKRGILVSVLAASRAQHKVI